MSILPRWVIIFIDFGIIVASTFLGYALRFNFEVYDIGKFNLLHGILTYSLIGVASIIVTKSYAGIVRYTGLEDGVRLLMATAINAGLAVLFNLLFYYIADRNYFPYSVVFISFFVSFLLLFFYRLLVKTIFSYYLSSSKKGYNTLIFGAGQSGLISKQVIDSDNSNKYNVVGFIEDDSNKVGKVLSGTKIYSSKKLSRLLESKDIKQLIISIKDISPARQNEIIDVCLKFGVKVRSVPPVENWVHGELSIKQIREIKIEDLLGRKIIKVDSPEVQSTLGSKIVLVTGAAGSIGSELVRQLTYLRVSKLILIDQAETPLHDLELRLKLKFPYVPLEIQLADVTDFNRLSSIFKNSKPDVVFHAAAYKHVPMMELNPSEAVLCNVCGTKNLADLSVSHGVERFVLISTDKAVNPTSIMGCSKRIAEMYVQAQTSSNKNNAGITSFITTRFGNVLGSNGSVIPRFKKQIDEGGPITVTHPEITRYFMTISEACNLVLEAAAMGYGGEVFVFDMGESVKIIDLAEKMIRLSGLEVGKDIEIKFTGLRDGEKLYEELLNDAENTIPTHHEKIMCAKLEQIEYQEINSNIDFLLKLSKEKSLDQMIALMKFIVPEYSSENKIYKNIEPSQLLSYPNKHSA